MVRQYGSGELTLRLRGLEREGPVRLHLEHKSGAALIVPACERRSIPAGHELRTRGFDGTDYRFTVDEVARVVRIQASAPTVLLGGSTEAAVVRGEDLTMPQLAALRITGDEDTMPISVKKP